MRMHTDMAFRSGDSECMLALRPNPAHAKARRQGVRTRRFRMHADKVFRSGDSGCKTTLKRRSDANRGVFCVRVETVESVWGAAHTAPCRTRFAVLGSLCSRSGDRQRANPDAVAYPAPCRMLPRGFAVPIDWACHIIHSDYRLSVLLSGLCINSEVLCISIKTYNCLYLRL